MNMIIPLDNENGEPAYIRLRSPDDPGPDRKPTTMRAQAPDRLSEDEWAYVGGDRVLVVDDKFWRGVKVASAATAFVVIVTMCATFRLWWP